MILVHGAGDTARVWRGVRDHLTVPSLALDIPGRGRHPADLTAITVDLAVHQAVQDITELGSGPVLLVAHSMGGALSPGILRQLGSQVVHLIHIAAVAAPDGALPLATASLEFADKMLTTADSLRRELRGTTHARPGESLPAGLRPLTDKLALTRIDSLNLGCVPTSWVGVDRDLPRTFIQPIHDRLYPAPAQRRLAAAMGAHDVRLVNADHNVARSAPGLLAALLNEIAAAPSVIQTASGSDPRPFP